MEANFTLCKNKLAEKYKEMFEPQIIYRGRNYYNEDKVLQVIKSDNEYHANVEGSNYPDEYEVNIGVSEEDISMQCTCPCINNCKHEYATLLAIDSKDYKELNLLPIEQEKVHVSEFIKSIPESRLIDYIIEQFEKDYKVEYNNVKKEFEAFLPEKTDNYIYATIYNSFVMENIQKVEEFRNLAKSALENAKYAYAFKIISNIIKAAKESKYTYRNTYLINEYNFFGTAMRIASRKGDEKLKIAIKEFIAEIEEKDYYNDIYLEDMILTIKGK